MNAYTKHTVTIDPYASSIKFSITSKNALLVVREISQFALASGTQQTRANDVSSVNIGDALIAVNGRSVFDFDPDEAMSVFAEAMSSRPSLARPFRASFIRYEACNLSVPYTTTRTCVTSPIANPRFRPPAPIRTSTSTILTSTSTHSTFDDSASHAETERTHYRNSYHMPRLTAETDRFHRDSFRTPRLSRLTSSTIGASTLTSTESPASAAGTPCRYSLATIRPSFAIEPHSSPEMALAELIPSHSSRSSLLRPSPRTDLALTDLRPSHSSTVSEFNPTTPVSEFSPMSVGCFSQGTSHEFTFRDGGEYAHIDRVTMKLVSGFIRRIHLDGDWTHMHSLVMRVAIYLCNNEVKFDVMKTSRKTPNSQCLLSSNGLFYGYHEFSIRIKRSVWAERQEIGVVSNADVDSVSFPSELAKGGVRDTNEFGARAVFGSTRHANYYVSLNDNKVRRSFKRLSVCKQSATPLFGAANVKNGKRRSVVDRWKQGAVKPGAVVGVVDRWKEGDVITVFLDLRKGSIKFCVNGQKPGKTMTLQKKKVYYPIVAFVGNCDYELMNPEHDIM